MKVEEKSVIIIRLTGEVGGGLEVVTAPDIITGSKSNLGKLSK